MRAEVRSAIGVQGIFVFILLILATLGGTKSFAQTPQALGNIEAIEQMRAALQASPWPPCKAFEESVTPEEWNLLRSTMRNGFIVQHLPVIDGLKVEFVENSQHLVPFLTLAGIGETAGTIHIPRQFIQNICKIISFNLAAQEGNETIRNASIKSLRNCNQSSLLATRCLLEVMSNLNVTPDQLSEMSDLEVITTFTNSFIVRYATLQTANYILAHEAGHAVIRNKYNTIAELSKIDEEFEADLLAQLAMIDQRILPIGPLSLLTAQALIEGEGALATGPHPPAICRIIQTQNVFVPIFPKLSAILVALKNSARGVSFEDSDFFSNRFSQLRPIQIPWTNKHCLTILPERASLVISDIDRIESAIRLDDGTDFENRTRNLKIVTQEGRQLQLAIAVVSRLKSPENAETVAKIRSGLNDVTSTNRFLSLINDTNALIQSGDAKILRPNDLAAIIQFDAMARYITKGRGTPIEAASREYVRNFESSFSYQALGQNANDMKAKRKIIPELKQTQDELLAETMSFMPWVAASIIMENCRSALLLRDAFGVTKPANEQSWVTEISKVDCQKLRRLGIENLKTGFGWVWDGQPLDEAPAQ